MMAGNAGVAQWLEHHSYKVAVEGSIPSARTFSKKNSRTQLTLTISNV
jgi:hypothetical protein